MAILLPWLDEYLQLRKGSQKGLKVYNEHKEGTTAFRPVRAFKELYKHICSTSPFF